MNPIDAIQARLDREAEERARQKQLAKEQRRLRDEQGASEILQLVKDFQEKIAAYYTIKHALDPLGVNSGVLITLPKTQPKGDFLRWLEEVTPLKLDIVSLRESDTPAWQLDPSHKLFVEIETKAVWRLAKSFSGIVLLDTPYLSGLTASKLDELIQEVENAITFELTMEQARAASEGAETS